MDPDPLAILAETLKNLEDSIEAYHNRMQTLKYQEEKITAELDLVRGHRENLIAIRDRLACKLPA